MKAIIPVAGYGTRMRPHTDDIQKALLPVGGKPALAHIVEPLLKAGISNITFIIGHLGNQVIDFMGKYEGNFHFVEQKEMLGLGHAVLQGLENTDERLIIQLGDNFFDTNIVDFISDHVNRIAVAQVKDPRRFGVVELENNRIIAFHEKPENPPSNFAISGLYLFKSQRTLKNAIEHLVEQNITTKNEYQLTDAFKIMLNNGAIFEPWKCGWMDTGVPETMLLTNRQMLKNMPLNSETEQLTPPIYIGNNVHIIHSKIGPNVTVMDNVILENCIIEDSIILEGSHLVDKKLSHCIVGKDGSSIC